MNIEKYGVSSCCGYGVLIHDTYVSDYFSAEIDIVAKSPTVSWNGMVLNGPSYMRGVTLINKDGWANDHSIFVVFDKGMNQWREYFTGTSVEVAMPFSTYSRPKYDIDSPDPTLHINRKLSISNPNIVGADYFAERISCYSDKIIKDMARQIQERNAAALNWEKELDNIIVRANEIRAQKESELSSVKAKLASSFGKYSSATHDSVNNNSLSDSGNKDSLRVQRIRAGCCTNCGGAFGGVFIKTCKNCGQRKDY